jgi:hypothetical protein
MDYRKQAYHIRDVLGGQPIPLKSTKTPSIKWKHLQTNVITDKEIEEHFKDCSGIALLCGSDISPFICLDFDLKNEHRSNKFVWEAFREHCPVELLEKMLVNRTQSKKGYHIWAKTDFKAKSSAIITRYLTIPELYEKYNKVMEQGNLSELAASRSILKKTCRSSNGN